MKKPIDVALKIAFALAMIMIILAYGVSVMIIYAAPSDTGGPSIAVVYDAEYEPPEDDIILLAKMMYGECRGIKSDAEKAACCWCAINRVGAWGDTLAEVVTPRQFCGYSPNNPVWDELYDIARDVLIRWHREQQGYEDVGRVLPAEYTYFCSNGRGHNAFRTTWRRSDQNCRYWDWSLPSPYESEGAK